MFDVEGLARIGRVGWRRRALMLGLASQEDDQTGKSEKESHTHLYTFGIGMFIFRQFHTCMTRGVLSHEAFQHLVQAVEIFLRIPNMTGNTNAFPTH